MNISPQRGRERELRGVSSCQHTKTVWADGEKVLNYLHQVDTLGLTGEIRFDEQGFRTDIQLDLIEKVREEENLLKVSNDWNTFYYR